MWKKILWCYDNDVCDVDRFLREGEKREKKKKGKGKKEEKNARDLVCWFYFGGG